MRPRLPDMTSWYRPISWRAQKCQTISRPSPCPCSRYGAVRRRFQFRLWRRLAHWMLVQRQRGAAVETDYDFLNLFGSDEGTVVLATGARLFGKGDPAHTMHIVRSGAIEVHDGDTVFETVMAGGLLGEMAIVDGAPRSAGARAKVESEV